MISRRETNSEGPGERPGSVHSQSEWKALALEAGFYSDVSLEALLDRLERAVLAR